IAPAALLADPASDPVAIARLTSDPSNRWQLVIREIDDQARISLASWVSFQATNGNAAVSPPALRRFLPIAPILADARWYSAQPLVLPTTAIAQGSLPRLTNLSGLIPGQTLLADEVLLLYPRTVVMASALAGMLSWAWNGTTFVPPVSPVSI